MTDWRDVLFLVYLALGIMVFTLYLYQHRDLWK